MKNSTVPAGSPSGFVAAETVAVNVKDSPRVGVGSEAVTVTTLG